MVERSRIQVAEADTIEHIDLILWSPLLIRFLTQGDLKVGEYENFIIENSIK